MTTNNNIIDPLAIADSSTRPTHFHIKVDNSYIQKFNQIHSYYQSETSLIKLAKQHVFKIIVDQHFDLLLTKGLIINDTNQQQINNTKAIINNPVATKPQQKDPKLDIPSILREHREKNPPTKEIF